MDQVSEIPSQPPGRSALPVILISILSGIEYLSSNMFIFMLRGLDSRGFICTYFMHDVHRGLAFGEPATFRLFQEYC